MSDVNVKSTAYIVSPKAMTAIQEILCDEEILKVARAAYWAAVNENWKTAPRTKNAVAAALEAAAAKAEAR